MERSKKEKPTASEKDIDGHRNQKEKQGVGAIPEKSHWHAAAWAAPAITSIGSMHKKPAILLCGHGSRDCGALEGFRSFVDRVGCRLPDRQIGHGFLEFAEPDITQGLENLRAQGAREIHAVALTLFEGRHASTDIPALLQDFGRAHPDLALHYRHGFNDDEKISAIVEDRIREAEAAPAKRAESFLLLVARGTAKKQAGEFYQKMARRLQERLGFAGALAAFSGLAAPSVTEGLEIARQAGATRILVVPCFLFAGNLLTTLHKTTIAATEAGREGNAAIEILVTAHLFGHPLLEEAMVAHILDMPFDCGRD